MADQAYLDYWQARYRRDLVENIFPFWLKHGLDTTHGGVYTALDREGRLMDSTKSVWFQGRFAYVLSNAYNQIECNEAWLKAAKSCIDFIEEHCFDKETGRMYFEVTAEGRPLRLRRYVFSESFAAIAMAEYALASGDRRYAERALEIFRQMRHSLATPGILAPKYMPEVELRGHSITMIMLNVANVLKQVLDEPELDEQIRSSLHDIEHYFMNKEYQCVLEVVGKNGEFIDTMMGRQLNPGHAIETAWFVLDAVQSFPKEEREHYIQLGLKILDWSWQWGWDKEYGGIINFVDCKGYPAQDYAQDMKFWWPQTEAIIATLYAYRLTGEERYLKWHEEVSDWTYAHFPDREHPEWFGYLHRDGTVAQPAKGNLFKGPFHIPRMMIRGVMLCR